MGVDPTVSRREIGPPTQKSYWTGGLVSIVSYEPPFEALTWAVAGHGWPGCSSAHVTSHTFYDHTESLFLKQSNLATVDIN